MEHARESPKGECASLICMLCPTTIFTCRVICRSCSVRFLNRLRQPCKCKTLRVYLPCLRMPAILITS